MTTRMPGASPDRSEAWLRKELGYWDDRRCSGHPLNAWQEERVYRLETEYAQSLRAKPAPETQNLRHDATRPRRDHM